MEVFGHSLRQETRIQSGLFDFIILCFIPTYVFLTIDIRNKIDVSNFFKDNEIFIKSNNNLTQVIDNQMSAYCLHVYRENYKYRRWLLCQAYKCQ